MYNPEEDFDLDPLASSEGEGKAKTTKTKATKAKKDESLPSKRVQKLDDVASVVAEGVLDKSNLTGEPHWYVIHCYSGQENKVQDSIRQRIESMGMQDRIFDVLVPTEEEIEIKDGKRRKVERRVFPGYMLVKMIMDEDSWYVVRNTPGVTGFVGMGNEPTPLRPDEMAQIQGRMEQEATSIKLDYKVGEKVRIKDGPFVEFTGVVSDIDTERHKVRVMVSFFGRDTPVELDFLQVEKVQPKP